MLRPTLNFYPDNNQNNKFICMNKCFSQHPCCAKCVRFSLIFIEFSFKRQINASSRIQLSCFPLRHECRHRSASWHSTEIHSTCIKGEKNEETNIHSHSHSYIPWHLTNGSIACDRKLCIEQQSSKWKEKHSV